MEKLLILVLCAAFFCWGYYDYRSLKVKSNEEDTEFERYNKKLLNFRSLMLIIMPAVVFVAVVINIILEWCDK